MIVFSVITPDLSDDMMFMPDMSAESQILTPALIKKVILTFVYIKDRGAHSTKSI